ncbi:type I-C CRISPR-associated protein Cas8c/Csd1 [Paenibacillus xylaniclasticus]|uniref:type I-C CRISPR-associated protein Cas8c/Csd1 n=1 Tax=Paenibacillus xylaniclasticus TaxID=588083 RepID=UPI000FD811EF|nr:MULTISPECIES: type I-C CRISPR-associated protein Cas8c/Csd1 [Paenibacillus]GFN33932.1 type I-C CRISPR-associated protein Cas8c/Csd1 [Paenibacillus curdlanolyticus]
MILLRLKEYYDRKAANGEIATDGWIEGGIDFLLELDQEGRLCDISDLREGEGKKKKSKAFRLPNIGNQALKHSNSGKDANLLWDNAKFVFGLGSKGDLHLQSMIEAIDEWLGATDDAGVKAVRTFLQHGLADRNHFMLALGHPEYGELLRAGSVKVSFNVKETPYPIVFQSPSVASALEREESGEDESVLATCLITGETDVAIAVTHPVVKGVKGAQSSGGSIVSFNGEVFTSYGKKQSLNAPVSKKAAAEYTKALNMLLESKQRIIVGDMTLVFWSEKETAFESEFAALFEEPPKDNPDEGVEKIKALFHSIHSGAYVEDSSRTRFYIAGLSPNIARVSIRLWQTGTVSEFAARIRQYFEDFSIVKPANEPEYYSLWRILVNIAVLDKSENIPPNLAGEFMRAILEGTPYPTTLLQAVLRRIRSDTENRVKPVRAALIKAYLNRYLRYYPNQSYKEVGQALDTNQTSIGYHLGSLFAVLEKIQEEANPGINATIRERYYGGACTTPVTVFPNLLRLKNHHLAKLDHTGRVIYFEKLLAEVMGNVNKFPAHLNLQEQGMFAVGYYHQRQDLFKSRKVETLNSVNSEEEVE